MSTDMNITLHIDRLILNGVNISHRQRHLLQASVQTEVIRLFTKGGMSPSLATGDDLVRLGRQIAQSVYGGINHE
ncbi:hypothetical protein [Nitrosovibrio sp. Nv6]|uniref:hypothetical protein n=1 Tax=Nitrosovibrio sp. Nv6 TaxID=1855340 RepID=UPI0008BC5E41|nr:hypothetical protein [Nitrosovibrio sp. Nv6]SEO73300.1 hypothetical protein SAMN05216316_0930 [Nitrosovibrio sp. Nv6]